MKVHECTLRASAHMLKLGEKIGLPMPINRAVYELAKERFGPNFQPMTKKERYLQSKKELNVIFRAELSLSFSHFGCKLAMRLSPTEALLKTFLES